VPEIIDLSHPIADGTITYPGLPAPAITDHLSREASRERYADGFEFQIGRIDMVANTGTYVDAPFHRYAHGRDLSELSLTSLADVDCLVVRPRLQGRAIGPEAFADLDVRGRAVLVQTGWDANWRTGAYFEGHPHLTEAAALHLADRGAVIVGIDSYNIDNVDEDTRPVHTVLLGRDIPICEHMCNLRELPAAGSRFFAVPVKVKGMGTFPVRAFAIC
jgi:arylformamidase